MPINKGESKMRQIQEVLPMTGGNKGISLLIDSWRNQISHDQQYREFTQNSIESIKRVQKKDPSFKGLIKWEVDENYYRKHKVQKLSIIDNGEGMTPQEMIENLNSLGSSSGNNEYYNHGCGAKIAGLAHNRGGLLYKSWKNGKGFLVKFQRNEMGQYGATKIGGRCSHPLADEMKPSIIKDHGCVVTLLGDEDKQDTTIPPKNNYGLLKGSREAKSEWLTCYLNTKFYRLAENIKISVSRFKLTSTGGVFNNIVKGHEYGLKLDFEKQEEIQLTKTKVKIFYRKESGKQRHTGSNPTYMTLGQLAVVNQDQTIKLEFAGTSGANPLPAWGLQCLRKNVALVLIPEGTFKQNIERTDLVHDGMRIQEQLNLWKNEFKDKMPKWLKDIEAAKQQEQLDKDNDNEHRLKKLAHLFKKERYFNSSAGDTDIEQSDKRRASSKKGKKGDNLDPNPNPYADPRDEFGKIEAMFGVKVDRSQYTGKKINVINEYPELLKTKEGPSHVIGTFTKDPYSVEVNVESNLVVELVNHLSKKFPKIMKQIITDEVFKMLGFSLQQQIAHVSNRTDYSEDEISRTLSDLCLTACAANKDFVIDRLSTRFKMYNNWKNQNVIKDKLPSFDATRNIHAYDPNKYVYKNSRK
jgi:hypothetical protein